MLVARSFAVPRCIRLAVFDLDGTLVTHHYAYWCAEAVRIYPLLGAGPVTLSEMRRDFGRENFFAALPALNRDGLVSKFWELYDEQGSPCLRCLPRIRTSLKQIKAAGMLTAIATARMESCEALTERLKRWRLSGLVDFALTCVESEEQPCPSKVPMLLQLLRLAGVSGREAMMVGDVPSDIKCARAAGYAIQVAVCTGGIHSAVLAAAEPTVVLRAVSSLHCPSSHSDGE